MMRVIVAGNTKFKDYNMLKERLDFYLQNRLPNVTILTKGLRKIGEIIRKYAEERNLKVEEYHAQWRIHGGSADLQRNITMVENADCLIAFWNGKTKTTREIISTARDMGLIVRVIKFT
jgi:hypothetical protein